MNVGLFETLSKYAGLGGIAIGFCLTLWGLIIKSLHGQTINSSNNPSGSGLSSDQKYDLYKSTIRYSFIVGVLGILVYAFLQQSVNPTGTPLNNNQLADAREEKIAKLLVEKMNNLVKTGDAMLVKEMSDYFADNAVVQTHLGNMPPLQEAYDIFFDKLLTGDKKRKVELIEIQFDGLKKISSVKVNLKD